MLVVTRGNNTRKDQQLLTLVGLLQVGMGDQESPIFNSSSVINEQSHVNSVPVNHTDKEKVQLLRLLKAMSLKHIYVWSLQGRSMLVLFTLITLLVCN